MFISCKCTSLATLAICLRIILHKTSITITTTGKSYNQQCVYSVRGKKCSLSCVQWHWKWHFILIKFVWIIDVPNLILILFPQFLLFLFIFRVQVYRWHGNKSSLQFYNLAAIRPAPTFSCSRSVSHAGSHSHSSLNLIAQRANIDYINWCI